MRKTYLACLVAGLLATPVSPASASHGSYTGGCTLAASWTSNTTWTGSVALGAVASPALAAISVECALRVDGVDGDVVLVGSGTGVVTGAVPLLTFTANQTSVVEICEHVVVDHDYLVNCHP